MDTKILRNEAAHRLETTVEDTLCVLDYRLHRNLLEIDHVGVPDRVSGRGIAGELTKAAFDMARREGWRVVPHCAYAAAWVKRHPEYLDLLDSDA